MNRTSIEWVKNPDGTPGYTWNPITGCLNGCPYCYARKLANGRLKQRYLANTNTAYMSKFPDIGYSKLTNPFYPRFWEDKLFELNPIARTSKGIFVCDMSDLFGIGVPDEWTSKVMEQIKLHPEHRFYLLTKQPQNLIKFSPFPDNCYVGVTATNNTSLDKAMLGLADIVASKRYISFEPLLLPVNFSEEDAELLDWLIIGQQTPVSAKTQPKIEYIREIVEAADKAGIPVFLKDNLSPLIKWPDSGSWAFENLSNIIRQEMPK